MGLLIVLDKRNQHGLGTMPKWDPKEKAGMCLGRSASNAGNVSLVWNLSTGYVSSQYQVVFNDNLSTFRCFTKYEAPPNWEQLVRDHYEDTDLECTDLHSTWNL